ncbi:probable serine/threonine-protein kinase fhkE [Chrysoperla carnea]|uniref:probable serine/threonine-protein kinase fhkE n=1 Tax=Chrysoperla carnea TaxID=189513 RepID=UPI001D078130|nr:probable serine/threonine-protein kinase fhkE [Chrysoperla carnea]
MIHVDESDPVGELEPSFPYRDVTIKRGVEAKEFYDLESEIGRGKFGTVYKCREKSTGLTLAAKFVPVPRREDRRNVEREVEIMRQLQHPRLIQLYDAFDNGKVMCVVLELIEGGELFERVIDDDFILTEKSCTVFMRQICEGIEFIHKQNILHLDMKPENILCLTKSGNRIKIIDFGLARRYDPNKKLQVLFGTPEFVAPEVVNFDQIGYGTDMWSVGVICYVLLSGLSPFMGETDIETMANVTVAKYDFDDEAFNEISQDAKDFITKLLVKDREARATASDCLTHPWLRRKLPPPTKTKTPPPTKVSDPITIPPSTPGLDTAKDNLRAFVERWGEHPDSPYLFDVSSHVIMPCPLAYNNLTSSQHSLRGMSPSPCGSLGSSPDSVIEYENNTQDNISDYEFDHIQNSIERRASDSSCVVSKRDSVERINLAEEIKKLSDKLFQLATMPTDLVNGNANSSSSKDDKKSESTTKAVPTKDEQKSLISEETTNETHKIKTEKVKTSKTVTNGNVTSISTSTKTSKISTPLTNGNATNINAPWANNLQNRRTKFKITNLNRDVPIISPTNKNSFFTEDFNTNKLTHSFTTSDGTSSSSSSSHFSRQSSLNSATNTKDLLLQLLDKWDDSQESAHNNLNGRHKSISVDFENETLGQRTISSLNTFFQSRQTLKKTHPFMSSN